ncbi:MAG: helix-turn-helix transcriptional regulator, partial [Armatimonadota bacterium]|nr:helix-turn-helix transcriptional regulator [Armatimonadota bacterium]
PTPAEHARMTAGYTLEEAARRLRLHPRYLRSLELHGGASLKMARKLADLYGCDGNVFVYAPAYLQQLSGHGAAAGPLLPPAAATDRPKHQS